MKDMGKIEKVETPVKTIKKTPTAPAPVRRTMGGPYRVIKARGFGAATRGYDFHERD
ncbi:MAG: hypothetical protein ACR2PN_00030 [Luminiphilus sp.]|jgi:hypothetical protein|tara:strand:+ start:584 stop:754 length:171 start_codon:yes stop_codon:yes gene_type:complete